MHGEGRELEEREQLAGRWDVYLSEGEERGVVCMKVVGSLSIPSLCLVRARQQGYGGQWQGC